MLMQRRVLLASIPCPALVASCASPTPVLYSLAPVSGAPRPGAPKVVALREVSLARYLERSQIVRSSEDYQLQIEANNWWGEPLGAMITRVLSEELSQRLPGTSVFAENGAISVDPDATVETNILRLDADRNGTVVLAAQIAVTSKRKHGTSSTRGVRLAAQPQTSDLRGEVGAMSVALGQLADIISEMLRS
jgi:uncharacterized lipoprotein YmbA